MLRFIALREVRTHENVEHSQRKENVIYRDRSRVVDLLLQLKNKQQIMHTKKIYGDSTQAHVFVIYW